MESTLDSSNKRALAAALSYLLVDAVERVTLEYSFNGRSSTYDCRTIDHDGVVSHPVWFSDTAAEKVDDVVYPLKIEARSRNVELQLLELEIWTDGRVTGNCTEGLPPKEEPYSRTVRLAGEARDKAWASVGTIEEDVLTVLMAFGSGWPVRPCWRVIRRGGQVIVASHGLSDPEHGAENALGFGVEIFIEADAGILPPGTPIQDLGYTWVYAALSQMANVVIGHGSFADMLEREGLVSVELDGENFQPHLRSDHGKVGALIGVPADGIPDRISLPAGEVRFVPITILTPDELTQSIKWGAEARQRIADRFRARGTHHRSSISEMGL